jgi:hypothetical protein
VGKTTKKKGNKFRFVLNRHGSDSFDRALELVKTKQPSNWLCPLLAQSLKFILNSPELFPNMRVVVWELYCGNELAAVEIGYCCGRIYTSMTGAFDARFNHAGTVQLCVTGMYLKKLGFDIWDLGMNMEYKGYFFFFCFFSLFFVSQLFVSFLVFYRSTWSTKCASNRVGGVSSGKRSGEKNSSSVARGKRALWLWLVSAAG